MFKVPSQGTSLSAIGEPVPPIYLPISDCYEYVPLPGPNDWLNQYQEEGQTFNDFVNGEFEAPDETRKKIYLVPIGSFNKDHAPNIDILVKYVKVFFDTDRVELLPAIEIQENPSPSNKLEIDNTTKSNDVVDATVCSLNDTNRTNCSGKTKVGKGSSNKKNARDLLHSHRKPKSSSKITTNDDEDIMEIDPSTSSTPELPIPKASTIVSVNILNEFINNNSEGEDATSLISKKHNGTNNKERKDKKKKRKKKEYIYLKLGEKLEPVTCRKALDFDELQLCISDILDILECTVPSDAFCLIGLTLWDLYMDASDLFIVGLSSSGFSGCFSFARYDPVPYKETNFHEILHLFGISHCIYFSCLMNGTASLYEDDMAPFYLCPVCERKLQYVLKFDVLQRYKNMLNFFTNDLSEFNFKEETTWVTKKLAYLNSLTEEEIELSYKEVVIPSSSSSSHNHYGSSQEKCKSRCDQRILRSTKK
ncbi:hypothetical protein ABK040_012762 [Willaertia magna]